MSKRVSFGGGNKSRGKRSSKATEFATSANNPSAGAGGSVVNASSSSEPITNQELDEDEAYVVTQCSICQGTGDDDLTILCDGENCNKEAHLYCLQPLYFKIPEGNWYCDTCDPHGTTAILEKYLNDYDGLFQEVHGKNNSGTEATQLDSPAPCNGTDQHPSSSSTASSSSASIQATGREAAEQTTMDASDSNNTLATASNSTPPAYFKREIIHNTPENYQNFLNLLAQRIISWKSFQSLLEQQPVSIGKDSNDGKSIPSSYNSVIDGWQASIVRNPDSVTVKCPRSEFDVKNNDYIGYRMRIYNVLDNRFHTGRIIGKRIKRYGPSIHVQSNGATADEHSSSPIDGETHDVNDSAVIHTSTDANYPAHVQYLVHFKSGGEGRNSPLIRWISLEEHPSIIFDDNILWVDRNNSINGPVQRCLRSGLFMIYRPSSRSQTVNNNDEADIGDNKHYFYEFGRSLESSETIPVIGSSKPFSCPDDEFIPLSVTFANFSTFSSRNCARLFSAKSIPTALAAAEMEECISVRRAISLLSHEELEKFGAGVDGFTTKALATFNDAIQDGINELYERDAGDIREDSRLVNEIYRKHRFRVLDPIFKYYYNQQLSTAIEEANGNNSIESRKDDTRLAEQVIPLDAIYLATEVFPHLSEDQAIRRFRSDQCPFICLPRILSDKEDIQVNLEPQYIKSENREQAINNVECSEQETTINVNHCVMEVGQIETVEEVNVEGKNHANSASTEVHDKTVSESDVAVSGLEDNQTQVAQSDWPFPFPQSAGIVVKRRFVLGSWTKAAAEQLAVKEEEERQRAILEEKARIEEQKRLQNERKREREQERRAMLEEKKQKKIAQREQQRLKYLEQKRKREEEAAANGSDKEDGDEGKEESSNGDESGDESVIEPIETRSSAKKAAIIKRELDALSGRKSVRLIARKILEEENGVKSFLIEGEGGSKSKRRKSSEISTSSNASSGGVDEQSSENARKTVNTADDEEELTHATYEPHDPPSPVPMRMTTRRGSKAHETDSNKKKKLSNKKMEQKSPAKTPKRSRKQKQEEQEEDEEGEEEQDVHEQAQDPAQKYDEDNKDAYEAIDYSSLAPHPATEELEEGEIPEFAPPQPLQFNKNLNDAQLRHLAEKQKAPHTIETEETGSGGPLVEESVLPIAIESVIEVPPPPATEQTSPPAPKLSFKPASYAHLYDEPTSITEQIRRRSLQQQQKQSKKSAPVASTTSTTVPSDKPPGEGELKSEPQLEKSIATTSAQAALTGTETKNPVNPNGKIAKRVIIDTPIDLYGIDKSKEDGKPHNDKDFKGLKPSDGKSQRDRSNSGGMLRDPRIEAAARKREREKELSKDQNRPKDLPKDSESKRGRYDAPNLGTVDSVGIKSSSSANRDESRDSSLDKYKPPNQRDPRETNVTGSSHIDKGRDGSKGFGRDTNKDTRSDKRSQESNSPEHSPGYIVVDPIAFSANEWEPQQQDQTVPLMHMNPIPFTDDQPPTPYDFSNSELLRKLQQFRPYIDLGTSVIVPNWYEIENEVCVRLDSNGNVVATWLPGESPYYLNGKTAEDFENDFGNYDATQVQNQEICNVDGAIYDPGYTGYGVYGESDHQYASKADTKPVRSDTQRRSRFSDGNSNDHYQQEYQNENLHGGYRDDIKSRGNNSKRRSRFSDADSNEQYQQQQEYHNVSQEIAWDVDREQSSLAQRHMYSDPLYNSVDANMYPMPNQGYDNHGDYQPDYNQSYQPDFQPNYQPDYQADYQYTQPIDTAYDRSYPMENDGYYNDHPIPQEMMIPESEYNPVMPASQISVPQNSYIEEEYITGMPPRQFRDHPRSKSNKKRSHQPIDTSMPPRLSVPNDPHAGPKLSLPSTVRSTAPSLVAPPSLQVPVPNLSVPGKGSSGRIIGLPSGRKIVVAHGRNLRPNERSSGPSGSALSGGQPIRSFKGQGRKSHG